MRFGFQLRKLKAYQAIVAEHLT